MKSLFSFSASAHVPEVLESDRPSLHVSIAQNTDPHDVCMIVCTSQSRENIPNLPIVRHSRLGRTHEMVSGVRKNSKLNWTTAA